MIFAVYKPKGITSNAFLNHLRRAAGTKKIGHAGTLDPSAEGVLVIGVGRDATKRLSAEVAKEKEYTATIQLGVISTTDDQEGEKTEQNVIHPPSRERIESVLRNYRGFLLQVPPVYSAVKVRGKEAYKRVRAGELIELMPRRIEIKQIDVLSYGWPYLILCVITGPGAYIRALARDIGKELACGGYLSSLIRTRVGQWTVKEALSLDEAIKKVVG